MKIRTSFVSNSSSSSFMLILDLNHISNETVNLFEKFFNEYNSYNIDSIESEVYYEKEEIEKKIEWIFDGSNYSNYVKKEHEKELDKLKLIFEGDNYIAVEVENIEQHELSIWNCLDLFFSVLNNNSYSFLRFVD